MALVYIIGLIFLALAFASKSPVAWISAAYFLSLTPLRDIMETAFVNPFPRFAFFALIAVGLGTYMFMHGRPILGFAGAACYGTALVIMLASKQAFMGDYFYRTWEHWSAGMNIAIAAPIMLYLGGLMRL